MDDVSIWMMYLILIMYLYPLIVRSFRTRLEDSTELALFDRTLA